MSTQNAVVALIHDQLGTALKDFFQLGQDAPVPEKLVSLIAQEQSLLEQLQEVETTDDEKKAPNVTFGLVIDIVGNSVSSLFGHLPISSTTPPTLPLLSLSPELQRLFQNQLKFFAAQKDDLITMVTARDANTRRNAVEGLFIDGRTFFTQGLQGFFGDDIGAVLSLATIGNALEGSTLLGAVQVPKSIEQALLDYFFKKEGYQTIDSSNVVSPVHLSDIVTAAASGASGTSGPGDPDQLKSLFSKATAEHYVRDVIRVTVEAAYDTARNLRDTYETKKATVRSLKSGSFQDAIERKFVNWFRGFSAMAESTAMRTVEVATQGVSEFQTNPLIAAAAGTFAGTVARKLAQDSFLMAL